MTPVLCPPPSGQLLCSLGTCCPTTWSTVPSRFPPASQSLAYSSKSPSTASHLPHGQLCLHSGSSVRPLPFVLLAFTLVQVPITSGCIAAPHQTPTGSSQRLVVNAQSGHMPPSGQKPKAFPGLTGPHTICPVTSLPSSHVLRQLFLSPTPSWPIRKHLKFLFSSGFGRSAPVYPSMMRVMVVPSSRGCDEGR